MPHGFGGFKNRSISPITAINRGQFDTVFHVNFTTTLTDKAPDNVAHFLVRAFPPGALNARIMFRVEGAALFSIYEAPALTGLVSQVLPFNTHRGSPITPVSTFWDDFSFSDIGTPLLVNTFFPALSHGNVLIDAGGVGGEFVSKTNEDFVLQVENIGGKTNVISIPILFYEPPEVTGTL